MGGARATAFDLALLAGYAVLVSIAGRLLGIPRWDYLPVSLALAGLLAPGWLASRLICEAGDDLLDRVLIGAYLSFAAFAIVAYGCLVVGAGFDVFYGLWAALIVAAAAAASRWAGVWRWSACRRTAPVWALAGLCLVMLLALYRTPNGNDMLVMSNTTRHLIETRQFAPPVWTLDGFDLDKPMPRYRADLHHGALIALLVDLTGAERVGVRIAYIVPMLGPLLVLAMMLFVRAACGPPVGAFLAFGAVLAPVLLFDRPPFLNPYDYGFRLLNGPGIDKDFALFFVVPGMLYLGLRYVRDGRRRHLAMLAGGAVMAVMFHPMTAVYFVMTWAAAAVGFVDRSWRRTTVVAAWSAALLGVLLASGMAAGGHRGIEALTLHDYELRGLLFYWEGHYAGAGIDTMTIQWRDGVMHLNPWIFRHSGLLVAATWATAAWVVIAVIGWCRSPRLPQLDRDEWSALRMQLAFMAMLAAIFAAAPVFLSHWPHLWRGYERLHWGFFGLLAFAYLPVHVGRWCRRWAGGDPARLRRLAAAAWGLAVLVLADQAIALTFYGRTLIGRVPGLASRADLHGFRKRYRQRDIDLLADMRARPDPSPPPPNSPIRADDVALGGIGAHHAARVLVPPSHYACGYLCELYGDRFLRRFDAWRDAQLRLVTDRLIDWIRDDHVTVIGRIEPPRARRVQPDGRIHFIDLDLPSREAWISELAGALGLEITPLGGDLWRIEWGGS